MVISLPPDFHKNGYKKSAWICSYPCARWLVFGFARVHISRFRQNRRFSSVILPLCFLTVKTAKTPIKSGFSVGASILCNPFGGGRGIRTPVGFHTQTVFKTASLWPLRYASVYSTERLSKWLGVCPLRTFRRSAKSFSANYLIIISRRQKNVNPKIEKNDRKRGLPLCHSFCFNCPLSQNHWKNLPQFPQDWIKPTDMAKILAVKNEKEKKSCLNISIPRKPVFVKN